MDRKAPERLHPLRRWREGQRRWSARHRQYVQLSIAMAAREMGVSHQTWDGWERFEDDPASRLPARQSRFMERLVQFTGGAVQPSDFYDDYAPRPDRAGAIPESATGPRPAAAPARHQPSAPLVDADANRS